MVRFIIDRKGGTFAIITPIYIPIWLDLLSATGDIVGGGDYNLHSNMVRFIIPNGIGYCSASFEFTFQYG